MIVSKSMNLGDRIAQLTVLPYNNRFGKKADYLA